MTTRASPLSRADSELMAFVRGIEHRGLVLAENQCGHAGRARAAVLAGKAEFHERAARSSPDAWPALYWRFLLAQPALRVRLGRDPRNPFSLLDPGPRAALLLRFVAELEQAEGAQALDVSPDAYRHALFRAIETLRANGIDESWMRALRDRLRTDTHPAHVDASVDDGATGSHHGSGGIPSWVRPAMIAALCLLVVVGLGSFFWRPGLLGIGSRSVGGIETLRDHKPAEVLPATTNLLASGDFGLLSDPLGASIARDLDLYAWYATLANAANAPSNAATLPETTLPETSAPDVDADPSEGANAP